MNIDPHKSAGADESAVRELYRELPQPQPSAELDRAILLAARQALHNDKVVQLPPRPWHKRLLLPLSIAATVVLSFGVVLRLSHEQAAQVVQLQHADMLQAQEQSAAPAETAAPQAKAVAPQTDAAAMPQGSAPGAGVSRRPALLGALPKPGRQRAEPDAATLPAEQKAAPATAAAATAASEPARPPAVPAAVPALPAAQPAAAMAGGETAGRMAERAANDSAAGAPAAAAAPAAPALLRKALRAAAVAGDPALDEIRRLLASGERNQARAALLRYRGANPGVELPADLRILLDEPAAPAGKPQ